MANKMVSQLLLVALAVPQVICTNTSQSDYASFDEHVQKDCFKGGELPGGFGQTGIDLEANPASPCKTCSGSSYRDCLTCYEGSTLWFAGSDCAGICARDPTGPTVGEGNLFGGLKRGNIGFTSRRRKPYGAYDMIGEGASWKDESCCQPSWGPDRVRDGDRSCCRHGMDQFELTCKPKGCKNVPSAYYYPAHSKDPYKDCGGKFDSEVEVRMYSRASGSKFKYEGVETVDSVDACPEGKICNPYGIRRYSKGMPATLTRRGRADGGSPDSSENDNDDNDSPDSSEKSSESGSGGGGGCSNKNVKFASEQITCKKAQASGYCDKQNSDGRRRADGKTMASECGGCCGGGSGTSSDSDGGKKEECKACKKECERNGGRRCRRTDCKKECKEEEESRKKKKNNKNKRKNRDSLFEVAQEKDESVGTARSKEGLIRRTHGKAKTAATIDTEADIRLAKS
jgi:hypothetical protein